MANHTDKRKQDQALITITASQYIQFQILPDTIHGTLRLSKYTQKHTG